MKRRLVVAATLLAVVGGTAVAASADGPLQRVGRAVDQLTGPQGGDPNQFCVVFLYDDGSDPGHICVNYGPVAH